MGGSVARAWVGCRLATTIQAIGATKKKKRASTPTANPIFETIRGKRIRLRRPSSAPSGELARSAVVDTEPSRSEVRRVAAASSASSSMAATGARRRTRAIRIRKLAATMIRNRMTVIAAP